MSMVRDLIENVVGGALAEILRKTAGGTAKRRRRRAATKTGGAGTVLHQIEKMRRPARKRQVSRRRTVRARSKAKRRSA